MTSRSGGLGGPLKVFGGARPAVDGDVLIVGDGPAGSALASACVARGLHAILVGSGVPWANTYGVWADDRLGEHRAALRWQGTVAAGGRRVRALPVPYGIFDNEALQSRLTKGVDLQRGSVTALRHEPQRVAVRLADGSEITARVLVDATGDPPALLGVGAPKRSRLGRPAQVHADVALQTAYGVVFAERPVGVDGAVLMDWTSMADGVDRRSSFLYSMPMPNGQWLCEETSLAGYPPMNESELRDRLARRLQADDDRLRDPSEMGGAAHMTSKLPRVRSVERVSIPMRGGVPNRRDLTVGFGAAARYIHPATGYSISESLAMAPSVAAAVAAAVHLRQPTVEAARTVWAAVWTPGMIASRRLHDYGLRSLHRLGDDAGMFFDAFFDLPAERWMPYLRIDTSPSEVSATMLAVFRAVPWSVRRRLLPGPLSGGKLERGHRRGASS
jgi:lycopene beta-cyclase